MLYVKIMDILKCVDSSFFIKMYHKYNKDLCDNINIIERKQLNEIMTHFTTEYYHFIMPLTNNEININTILTAAAVAKKNVSNIENEELAKWLRGLIDDSFTAQKVMFPYIYDPNNDKEAYLETRKSKK